MNKQNYEITEERLDNDLKKQIYEGFSEHAISSVGSDGNMEEITFIARDSERFIGAVHCKTFWGALHIKYLYVAPKERGKGIGKKLIKQAFEKGINLGCRFAFVETMNFQAVNFYQSLGFNEELVRTGYDNGASFHYLKKNFHIRVDG